MYRFLRKKSTLIATKLDVQSDSSYLATYSRSSVNEEDARKRALLLYRKWIINVLKI